MNNRPIIVPVILAVILSPRIVPAQCLSDRDDSGAVTIDEVVCGVNNLLGGCESQTAACAPAARATIFGNGSAGSLMVAAAESVVLNQANTQYRDIIVDGTLSVASGTTLRATGSVAISGTVRVGTYVRGGGVFAPTTSGVGTRPATSGQFGDSGFLSAGYGGYGVPQGSARQLLNPGPAAGGGGMSHFGVTDGSGGAGHGGGSLRLFAAGPVDVSGVIGVDGGRASGGSLGGGAGAGGVLIIASKTSINLSGSCTARGGDGAESSATYAAGPGGGGGGGIIHLLAPQILNAGLLDVSGGAAGSNAEQPAGTGGGYRHAGGGGGAGGGNGGNGGAVSAGNVSSPAEPGQPGHAFLTLVDPTSLFQ